MEDSWPNMNQSTPDSPCHGVASLMASRSPPLARSGSLPLIHKKSYPPPSHDYRPLFTSAPGLLEAGTIRGDARGTPGGGMKPPSGITLGIHSERTAA